MSDDHHRHPKELLPSPVGSRSCESSRVAIADDGGQGVVDPESPKDDSASSLGASRPLDINRINHEKLSTQAHEENRQDEAQGANSGSSLGSSPPVDLHSESDKNLPLLNIEKQNASLVSLGDGDENESSELSELRTSDVGDFALDEILGGQDSQEASGDGTNWRNSSRDRGGEGEDGEEAISAGSEESQDEEKSDSDDEYSVADLGMQKKARRTSACSSDSDSSVPPPYVGGPIPAKRHISWPIAGYEGLPALYDVEFSSRHDAEALSHSGIELLTNAYTPISNVDTNKRYRSYTPSQFVTEITRSIPRYIKAVSCYRRLQSLQKALGVYTPDQWSREDELGQSDMMQLAETQILHVFARIEHLQDEGGEWETRLTPPWRRRWLEERERDIAENGVVTQEELREHCQKAAGEAFLEAQEDYGKGYDRRTGGWVERAEEGEEAEVSEDDENGGNEGDGEGGDTDDEEDGSGSGSGGSGSGDSPPPRGAHKRRRDSDENDDEQDEEQDDNESFPGSGSGGTNGRRQHFLLHPQYLGGFAYGGFRYNSSNEDDSQNSSVSGHEPDEPALTHSLLTQQQ
ncbi:hypothetical protein MKZ38_010508 [Zalerion maritima]|uniref:Uncharacterized protein n=1 Tax=Zalerion maritima TaxID=339359 RepID=A0AAD5WN95_9PEZI|nr:hypothetical protein MKZ38_010508 [Zalerion maritima]